MQELLKGAGPWAAFLLLAFLGSVAILRGWLVSRREYNNMRTFLQERLTEMTQQRDGYREIVNAQLEASRRRDRALNDALEGSRVVVQALQATPAPREIGPS